jgi:hypothetical protein
MAIVCEVLAVGDQPLVQFTPAWRRKQWQVMQTVVRSPWLKSLKRVRSTGSITRDRM